MAPPSTAAPTPGPHPLWPRQRTDSIVVGAAFLRARASAGIADALFANGTMLIANNAAAAKVEHGCTDARTPSSVAAPAHGLDSRRGRVLESESIGGHRRCIIRKRHHAHCKQCRRS